MTYESAVYAAAAIANDADRQAVEAIRQVHGIRFRDEDEHGERQVPASRDRESARLKNGKTSRVL